MFSTPAVIGSVLTYILMLVAWYFYRPRIWHVGVMTICIIFDMCVPFYLFFARHWIHLLIDKGEITDFLVWMHVGLDIMLYVVYYMQVRVGIQIWRGEPGVRTLHRQQATVILVVRFLVIMSGALLAPK